MRHHVRDFLKIIVLVNMQVWPLHTHAANYNQSTNLLLDMPLGLLNWDRGSPSSRSRLLYHLQYTNIPEGCPGLRRISTRPRCTVELHHPKASHSTPFTVKNHEEFTSRKGSVPAIRTLLPTNARRYRIYFALASHSRWRGDDS